MFQLAEKGIDVIIDEGFWAKEQRDEMRRRTEEVGAQSVLYYLDTPIETIQERVALRNMDPGKESFKISGDLLSDGYLKVFGNLPVKMKITFSPVELK